MPFLSPNQQYQPFRISRYTHNYTIMWINSSWVENSVNGWLTSGWSGRSTTCIGTTTLGRCWWRLFNRRWPADWLRPPTGAPVASPSVTEDLRQALSASCNALALRRRDDWRRCVCCVVVRSTRLMIPRSASLPFATADLCNSFEQHNRSSHIGYNLHDVTFVVSEQGQLKVISNHDIIQCIIYESFSQCAIISDMLQSEKAGVAVSQSIDEVIYYRMFTILTTYLSSPTVEILSQWVVVTACPTLELTAWRYYHLFIN